MAVTTAGRDLPRLQAISWNGAQSFAARTAAESALPLVLAIATPATTIRDTARDYVRQALREALAILLGLPPQHVPLISQPGQPIRLAPPWADIGLSISHEPGLTLAAIHMRGAVGVDLMRVDQAPEWLTDWESVAVDYLGPSAAERIAKHLSNRPARAFAYEWTRAEACLKCHGLPLQEWTPALERKLTSCQLFALDLPNDYVGTLAVRSAAASGM